MMCAGRIWRLSLSSENIDAWNDDAVTVQIVKNTETVPEYMVTKPMIPKTK